MTRQFGALMATVAVAAFINPVLAQQKRASPHETASATIGGAKVDISYGRPYKKGRATWGSPLMQVPNQTTWRLGADEATTLKTSAPLAFGSVIVPAGEYTLFLAHEGEGVEKLVINKQNGQWGTEYDPKQDLGWVELKRDKVDAPVEQLTIAIEPLGPGGVLKITWDDATYSAQFTVQK